MDQYRAAPADLVVTDIFMPTQDGLETILELRREFPGAAVVAISGNTLSQPMLSAAQNLGAAAVLAKPFSADQFLKVAGEALRGGGAAG